jgi:hypothetical protein
MSIAAGSNALASDFITQAEADATPSNDSGRVPQLEADGKLHGYFTRNGIIATAGETLSGATTPVPVYLKAADSRLYACDANDPTKYKFIGFVTSTATSGNSITFQSSGIVGGFSGLTVASKYYVQDAVGTIGTTAGTQAILVGVAVSATQILIMRGLLRANGNGSFSDGGNAAQTQDTAITLGFRPSRIKMSSSMASSNTHASSEGSWIEGTSYCTYSGGDAGFGGSAGSTEGSAVGRLAYVAGGASDHWKLEIISVTDTGFTIRATQNINSPATAAYVWEAEGEL